MALGSGGAEAGHAQVDDIRLHSAQLVVRQADALDYVDTVVIEHGVCLRDQVMQHTLPLGMFEIDRKRTFVAVEFEKARRKIRIFAALSLFFNLAATTAKTF